MLLAHTRGPSSAAWRSGVLRDAVFAWMDAHREGLRACDSPRDIEALPGWRQGVLEVVYAQAERDGWPWREPTEEEAAKLRHRFLAQVVRTHWGESASYEVLTEGDQGVARAIHALVIHSEALSKWHQTRVP